MRELIEMFIPLVHISSEAAAANGSELVSLSLAVFLKSFQGGNWRKRVTGDGATEGHEGAQVPHCALPSVRIDFSMADTVRELFEALSSVPQLEGVLAERTLPTLVRLALC